MKKVVLVVAAAVAGVAALSAKDLRRYLRIRSM
ncbi:MAG: DUF6893 family small protein [Candidatus Dormibacteria bacterium]